jgi:tRNA pseudouridine38-40 synthase
LAYHGGRFHGWQKQPEVRNVQGTVADTLQRILGHPVNLLGASRTDAGVHAVGQVASCPTSSLIPAEKLARAVAHWLPEDVSLRDLRDVPTEFHATHDARGKTYRYTIYHDAGRPVERMLLGLCWHVWVQLDVDRLRAAAETLVGRHDFAGFASAGSQPRRTTVRTIQSIQVRYAAPVVTIDVTGDGFLYNQVRNMVGTLVEIARGHWPVDRVAEVIQMRDRQLAGPTAPAHGLCLRCVYYPEHTLLAPDETDLSHGTD